MVVPDKAMVQWQTVAVIGIWNASVADRGKWNGLVADCGTVHGMWKESVAGGCGGPWWSVAVSRRAGVKWRQLGSFREAKTQGRTWRLVCCAR